MVEQRFFGRRGVSPSRLNGPRPVNSYARLTTPSSPNGYAAASIAITSWSSRAVRVPRCAVQAGRGINDNGSGLASLVDGAEQIGSGATGVALVWEYAARRR